MPPRKKTPVTFDQWLGHVIDNEARARGGRAAIAGWIGTSEQSVNRRARGEVPYLAREVEIIAERVGTPTATIVGEALRKYGGIGKLISEYEVSEGADSTVPVSHRARPGCVPRPSRGCSGDGGRSRGAAGRWACG